MALNYQTWVRERVSIITAKALALPKGHLKGLVWRELCRWGCLICITKEVVKHQKPTGSVEIWNKPQVFRPCWGSWVRWAVFRHMLAQLRCWAHHPLATFVGGEEVSPEDESVSTECWVERQSWDKKQKVKWQTPGDWRENPPFHRLIFLGLDFKESAQLSAFLDDGDGRMVRGWGGCHVAAGQQLGLP